MDTITYKVIELPPLTDVALAEFGKLPMDTFAGGEQRYRRFSQFRMDFVDDGWRAELLPHRPFIQPRSVNSYVGGVRRPFEPLRIDPSPQLIVGAEEIPLDSTQPWQVNVHQCRVVTNDAVTGVSVPEGPHRDGHTFGMLAVFDRKNIQGGVTQLFESGSSTNPFFETTLQPNQALVYDDGAMWHTATDIKAPVGSQGHRDLWIVAFNPWSERRYGDEFEAAAGV